MDLVVHENYTSTREAEISGLCLLDQADITRPCVKKQVEREPAFPGLDKGRTVTSAWSSYSRGWEVRQMEAQEPKLTRLFGPEEAAFC